MNEIVLPMKVLAVKLEYRRLLLEKMTKGFFKTKNDQLHVVITYDPELKKYTSRNRRVLSLSRKLGQEYADKINEYLRLKSEYDSLLNTWNKTYCFSPPRVKFPIKQFSDPHGMNNEYFNNQTGCLGKYVADNPTVNEQGVFKSKNEQFGSDLLCRIGIPFKYETEIYLPSIKETINPDYLVSFYEIDRCSYLEILGMNDKGEYSMRTATKINGFSRDKYRPGREVIYIHLYDKYNFDEDYFVSQVLTAFNDMIPDSALIWDAKTEVCSEAV